MAAWHGRLGIDHEKMTRKHQYDQTPNTKCRKKNTKYVFLFYLCLVFDHSLGLLMFAGHFLMINFQAPMLLGLYSMAVTNTALVTHSHRLAFANDN